MSHVLIPPPPHPPPPLPSPKVLLSVYFFLAGLLVKGHPFMWLLPLVSCGCSITHFALDRLSAALLPFYRYGGVQVCVNVWIWCLVPKSLCQHQCLGGTPLICAFPPNMSVV